MEEGEIEEGEIEEEKGTYNKKDAGTQGARSGIMYSSAPVRYQGFSKFRPSAVPTKEADVDALMRGLTNMVTHDQNSGGLSAKAIAAANAAAAMSSATAKANSKNYVPSEFSEADAAAAMAANISAAANARADAQRMASNMNALKSEKVPAASMHPMAYQLKPSLQLKNSSVEVLRPIFLESSRMVIQQPMRRPSPNLQQQLQQQQQQLRANSFMPTSTLPINPINNMTSAVANSGFTQVVGMSNLGVNTGMFNQQNLPPQTLGRPLGNMQLPFPPLLLRPQLPHQPPRPQLRPPPRPPQQLPPRPPQLQLPRQPPPPQQLPPHSQLQHQSPVPPTHDMAARGDWKCSVCNTFNQLRSILPSYPAIPHTFVQQHLRVLACSRCKGPAPDTVRHMLAEQHLKYHHQMQLQSKLQSQSQQQQALVKASQQPTSQHLGALIASHATNSVLHHVELGSNDSKIGATNNSFAPLDPQMPISKMINSGDSDRNKWPVSEGTTLRQSPATIGNAPKLAVSHGPGPAPAIASTLNANIKRVTPAGTYEPVPVSEVTIERDGNQMRVSVNEPESDREVGKGKEQKQPQQQQQSEGQEEKEEQVIKESRKQKEQKRKKGQQQKGKQQLQSQDEKGDEKRENNEDKSRDGHPQVIHYEKSSKEQELRLAVLQSLGRKNGAVKRSINKASNDDSRTTESDGFKPPEKKTGKTSPQKTDEDEPNVADLPLSIAALSVPIPKSVDTVAAYLAKHVEIWKDDRQKYDNLSIADGMDASESKIRPVQQHSGARTADPYSELSIADGVDAAESNIQPGQQRTGARTADAIDASRPASVTSKSTSEPSSEFDVTSFLDACTNKRRAEMADSGRPEPKVAKKNVSSVEVAKKVDNINLRQDGKKTVEIAIDAVQISTKEGKTFWWADRRNLVVAINSRSNVANANVVVRSSLRTATIFDLKALGTKVLAAYTDWNNGIPWQRLKGMNKKKTWIDAITAVLDTMAAKTEPMTSKIVASSSDSSSGGRKRRLSPSLPTDQYRSKQPVTASTQKLEIVLSENEETRHAVFVEEDSETGWSAEDDEDEHPDEKVENRIDDRRTISKNGLIESAMVETRQVLHGSKDDKSHLKSVEEAIVGPISGAVLPSPLTKKHTASRRLIIYHDSTSTYRDPEDQQLHSAHREGTTTRMNAPHNKARNSADTDARLSAMTAEIQRMKGLIAKRDAKRKEVPSKIDSHYSKTKSKAAKPTSTSTDTALLDRATPRMPLSNVTTDSSLSQAQRLNGLAEKQAALRFTMQASLLWKSYEAKLQLVNQSRIQLQHAESVLDKMQRQVLELSSEVNTFHLEHSDLGKQRLDADAERIKALVALVQARNTST